MVADGQIYAVIACYGAIYFRFEVQCRENYGK